MTTSKRLPTTEKRKPRSENIDERSPLEIVINPVVGPEVVTGLSRRWVQALLRRADAQVKAALVMHFHGVDLDRALEILKAHHQLLRPAIAEAVE